MSRQWIPESPPRWDRDKQAVVGAAPAGALPIGDFAEGEPVPGDWWRVEEDGEVVAYGWMEAGWEGAEMLLAVRPDRRGTGLGAWILDRLEDEARERGANYLFNTVQPTHPEREKVTAWLVANGFEDHDQGELRRRVRATPDPTRDGAP